MNTTALVSRSFSPAAAGWPARRADAGWFARPRPFTLDSGDFGTVAFTFALAAGLVLSAAFVCDAYLLAVVLRGVGSINDVAGYRLALDLLPWAAVFTAMTTVLTLAGLRAASLLRHRRATAAGNGFMR